MSDIVEGRFQGVQQCQIGKCPGSGCLLERDGLVVRTHHAEVPPRVEYEISALGYSLADLFAHLTDWGLTNLAEVERARQRYDNAAQPGARHAAR